MRKILYIISAIFTIIALILSFQNIATSIPVGIFFQYTNTNLFVPLFLLFTIGVFAGFFFALAIKSKESSSSGGSDF